MQQIFRFSRAYFHLSPRIILTSLMVLLSLLVPLCSIGYPAEVALAWNANTESDVKGYKLYMGTSTGVYTKTVDVGSQTHYTLSKLEAGRTYYFAVTAYDVNGNESDYSGELAYKVSFQLAAKDDASETYEDNAVVIDVLANDSAPDRDALQITSVTQAEKGSAVIDGNRIRYTPHENAFGRDKLVYRISDGKEGTATASVLITIAPVNDAPRIAAVPDQTDNEDASFGPIPFAVADVETPADHLKVTARSDNHTLLPAEGIVVEGEGKSRSIAITPAPNKSGTATVTLRVSDGSEVSSTTFSLVVHSVNDRPTASTQMISLIEDHAAHIALRATDPDQDALTYSIERRPSHGTLSVVDSPDTVRYVPDQDYSGEDSFTFTAFDGQVRSNVAQISIRVHSAIDSPVADAGPDQSVKPGATVKLSAANSTDPDGGPISYSWTQSSGPPVVLKNSTAKAPAFTAPEDIADGVSLTFRLTATNPSELRAVDYCIVNVSPGNLPPRCEAGAEASFASGDRVMLDATRSEDPDGSIDHYTWRQLAGEPVSLSDRAALMPEFEAPQVGRNGQSLIFKLFVRDSSRMKAQDTVIVNILGENLPPKAHAGANQIVGSGSEVILDSSKSTDPDDGIHSVRWTQVSGPPVALSSPIVSTPHLTAPAVPAEGMDLVFRLTVTDTRGLSSQDDVKVRVNKQ